MSAIEGSRFGAYSKFLSRVENLEGRELAAGIEGDEAGGEGGTAAPRGGSASGDVAAATLFFELFAGLTTDSRCNAAGSAPVWVITTSAAASRPCSSMRSR